MCVVAWDSVCLCVCVCVRARARARKSWMHVWLLAFSRPKTLTASAILGGTFSC